MNRELNFVRIPYNNGLSKKLTIRTRENQFEQSREVKCYSRMEKFMYIPYTFAHEIGATDIKHDLQPTENFGFNGKLNVYQQIYYDSIKRYVFNPPHSIIVVGGCGAGKTVLGIYIISALKMRCIILTHTKLLLDQWVSQIGRFMDMECGIIQGKTCDIKNITVGTVQSVVKKNLPDGYFDIIICDEVHRYMANTFWNSMNKFQTKVKIGLSATPFKRSDGLGGVVKLIMHYDPGLEMKKHKVSTEYYPQRTGVTIPDNLWTYTRKSDGKTNKYKMKLYSILAKIEKREDIICNLAEKAYEKGRNILILSKLVCQVKSIAEKLEHIGAEELIATTKNRNEALNARIISSTFQMFEEALDVPALDVLILTVMQWDIRQAVGRIQRVFEGKKNAIVVELVDNFMGSEIILANHKKLFKKELS